MTGERSSMTKWLSSPDGKVPGQQANEQISHVFPILRITPRVSAPLDSSWPSPRWRRSAWLTPRPHRPVPTMAPGPRFLPPRAAIAAPATACLLGERSRVSSAGGGRVSGSVKPWRRRRRGGLDRRVARQRRRASRRQQWLRPLERHHHRRTAAAAPGRPRGADFRHIRLTFE